MECYSVNCEIELIMKLKIPLCGWSVAVALVSWASALVVNWTMNGAVQSIITEKTKLWLKHSDSQVIGMPSNTGNGIAPDNLTGNCNNFQL